MTTPEQIDRNTKFQTKKIAKAPKKDSYYREYQDSPNFYINIGSLGTSSSTLVDLAEDLPETQKFLPLTTLQIVNSSNSDILLYFNQKSNGRVVPANTSATYDKQALGGGIRSIKILNSSTSNAIADKEVELNVWREAISVNNAFRKLHKSIWELAGRLK